MEAVIATSEPESFSSPAMRMASVSSKKRRLFSAPAVAKRLKRKGVQVILLNDLSSLWLAPVFRLYGLKVVSLLHLYLQRRNAAGLGHSWSEFHLLRMSSRFAQKVYSVNKNNQATFPVPVEVVGNFISSWFFEAAGVEAKCYGLGVVARLSPEKNIPLFVRLVAKLNDISPQPVRALIVGKGEEEARVRKEIERFGMEALIDLRPWADRSELPRIFDQLKCFAITSYHEGFATTLLEAHARGVPAITTRSAGFCPEFVQGWGPETGLVFDPEDLDSDEFLRTVLRLIGDSAAYAESCRVKAGKFTEDRVLGEIHSGIRALMRDGVAAAQ
ncbi:hypothetical protein C27AD_04702 [Salinisphaera hydrothermalis C27AD]